MRFATIPGQESIKQRLIQTVKESRVSHAQLFFGPEGSGKLAMALAYAQYINCTDRQNGDSCGHCPSCYKYERLVHPDLHFVFPVAITRKVAKNPLSTSFLKEWRELLLSSRCSISLTDWYEKIELENKQAIINAEDCNEIIKTLNFKPFEAEYKVMIIWMVEKLFHSAAPKLLKILEEPPDKTLFILISENHDQIISTILSRTQPVKFKKLSDTVVFEVLKARSAHTEEELRQITKLAGGNMVLASRLADEQADGAMFSLFSKWMRLCYQYKIAEIAEFADEMAALGRERQKNYLFYALRFIRESLVIPYQDPRLVNLTEEEKKFAMNFAPFVNRANGNDFMEELNRALQHIERNASPVILFMDLSLTVSRLLKVKPAG